MSTSENEHKFSTVLPKISVQFTEHVGKLDIIHRETLFYTSIRMKEII